MQEISREIVINGQKFAVVNSALMTVKMLHEYLKCVEELPALDSDILGRIIELLQV